MKKLTKKKSNKKKIKSFELIVRNFEALTPEGRLFFWQSLEGMASVGGESIVTQREKLQEILAVSTSSCWVTNGTNPVPGVVESSPASRDYEGGF